MTSLNSSEKPSSKPQVCAIDIGTSGVRAMLLHYEIPTAGRHIVGGVFAAGGQTCVAGSRVLVHGSVYDEVLQRVADRARAGQPRSTPRPECDPPTARTACGC